MLTEEMVKKQLETLYREGRALAKAFTAEEGEGESFEEGYQAWFSRALPLMKQLAADRYAEFQSYYIVDPKYAWCSAGAYVIQDYFRGKKCLVGDFEAEEEVAKSFRSQLAILRSVSERLAWASLETDDQAERSLQLALLETARGLIDVDARAAGVLAGTVLEGYLRKLAAKHKLKFRKQAPLLREYIEALTPREYSTRPLIPKVSGWRRSPLDRERERRRPPNYR